MSTDAPVAGDARWSTHGQGLMAYQAPICPADVQARYGYSTPIRCMAARHRSARPAASWLIILARPSPADVDQLGFRLSVVQAFAACRECVALIADGSLRAFPMTAWQGTL